MGIKNKEGALYWATGIDNSGLKKGKEEAVGLLKGFAKQVSGLDIFAGVGAAAALTFAKMVKGAYAFSKEFQTSMKEVQTISKATQENYEGMSDAIVRMSTEVPDSAIELSRALYEIVSAGYDGAEGLKILDAASRGAVAGVTTTTIAADGLTTILNAWKLETSEVTRVNDIMFRTVELGKITYDELAGSIAQVAPLAAASGVSFEEIGAAISTLTKQGTPGAQAITQIRSAMVAMNEQLGEGWGNTMTLQQGFEALVDISAKTGKQLNEVTGRVEGAMAVLATTGKNARGAAEDIQSIADSSGAAAEAFKTMAESADVQLKIISNNYKSIMKQLGDSLLLWSGSTAQAINDKLHELNYKSLDAEESYYRYTIDMLTNDRSKRRAYIKKYGEAAYKDYLDELRNALEKYKEERNKIINLTENDLNPDGSQKIKPVNPIEFQKELDASKKAYDEYQMLVTNGFKKEAEVFYSTQLENGKTYKDYLQNQLKNYTGDLDARKLIYLELSEIILKETEKQKEAEEAAFVPMSKRLETLNKMVKSINEGSASNQFTTSPDTGKTSGSAANAISRDMMRNITPVVSFVNEIQTKSERVSRTWDNIIEDITNPEAWGSAAEAVKEIGFMMSRTNEQAGEMMNGIGNIMSGFSSIISKGASPQAIMQGSIQAVAGLAQIYDSAIDKGKTFDSVIQALNRDLEKQQRILDASVRKGGADEAYQSNLDVLNEQKEALEIIVELGKQRVDQADKMSAMARLGAGININKLREDLSNYESQLQDVNNQIEDLGQSWTDFTAGLVTELDLADKIAEAFQEGKTSAADFANYVNDIMKDAVLEVFKASILGPQLTLAQEYLSKALEDKSLSGKEKAIFTKLFTDAGNESRQLWEDLGLNEYFKNDSGKTEDPNSLSGSIRASLTEETGSILAGTMNAMRMDVKEIAGFQLAASISLQSIDEKATNLIGIRQDLAAIKDSIQNIAL